MNAEERQVHYLLLARLGEKLVNQIVAGRVLGHDTVAGQVPYIHTDDPAFAVLSAFGRGRLDDAAEALAAYLADPQDVVRRITDEDAQRKQLKDALDQMTKASRPQTEGAAPTQPSRGRPQPIESRLHRVRQSIRVVAEDPAVGRGPEQRPGGSDVPRPHVRGPEQRRHARQHRA